VKGNDMKKNKSSLSKARSYAEIGEYWDQHDLNDVWGKTRKVKFEVVAEPEATYYPVERDLSEKIQSVAKKQGVSSDTLVNLWLEQKVKEQRSPRSGRKLHAKSP
jgi:CopG antitoxin of type II toxin-antitoxin system